METEVGIDTIENSTNETSKVVEELVSSTGGDDTSSIGSIMDKNTMMTVILDLNGVLVKRCPSELNAHHQTIIYSSNRYCVLRPGCIKFLEALLERFNVGIWSNAKDENVLSMVRRLISKAGKMLPLFVIWGQGGCHTYSKRKVTRPDQPNVEAMFKPLSKLSLIFKCDSRRTIIIDDSPYKCCVTPPNNSIFPPTFDIDNKNDNILMEELLPYLIQLDGAEDVRSVIASNRYGQLPVLKDHKDFDSIKDVIVDMEDNNMKWSQMRFHTGRLPICKQLKDSTGASTTKKIPIHTSSQHKGDEIEDILRRERPSISSKKPAELITLARKLGCKAQTLKSSNAKAYINKLLQDYGLLNNNM